MAANPKLSRRAVLASGGAATAATITPRKARAQVKDVKIAMLVPLSGPWARAGILEQMGAELAAEDINAAGGIKALGGAKIRLMPFDAGDSAETAKNAAQRLIASEPDLSGGFGCWLSSFTLAATEISERAELPWLTLSYSDLITDRGFKYVFQTSPTSMTQARDLLPILADLGQRTTGKRPVKVAFVGDNSAAPASIRKAFDEGGLLKDNKMEMVLNQIFTPPLTDATPVVQPVRTTRPDFAILLSTNPSDDKLLADKFQELGMGGGRLPLIGNGGHWATPELLKNVGAQNLEGIIVFLANWPGKQLEDLSRRFVAKTKEAWFGHDSIFAYAHMQIFKEAVERAGTADRRKVAEAIRTMDIKGGTAGSLFPDGRVKFDAKGRREGAQMVIIQWQKGKLETIWPNEIATAKPIWRLQAG